jgi:hypothetical protein
MKTGHEEDLIQGLLVSFLLSVFSKEAKTKRQPRIQLYKWCNFVPRPTARTSTEEDCLDLRGGSN